MLTTSKLHDKKPIYKKLIRLAHSVWLFPAILTLLLLVLTAFNINGSSIGVYQSYFYGAQKDTNLIAGKPEPIRSDEYLVNTQLTLAQSKDHYNETNKNIGNGENVSVLDVPYNSWSEIFKPHNLAFFVLPVDYAFAFKWWLMAYLLLVSCYFFVLSILPGKRLIAAAIATSLLFSAFVQWWYDYATLGPLYYCLFLGTALVYFLKQKVLLKKLLLALAIIYLVICFVLVLYPPFQIACAIALAGFIVGILIVYYGDSGLKNFLRVISWLASCLVISGAVVGLFVATNSSVVHTVDNTVYPGQRVVNSGGFSVEGVLSGNLGYQFMNPLKATDYRLLGQPTNQSEASNFLLLTPFLLLPSLLLLYMDNKRHKKTDWPLVGVNFAFILFMLELFVPVFTPISKFFFFDKVPLQRELIGLGLLNIIQLVLFIRNLSKKKRFTNSIAIPYAVLVFFIELALGIYVLHHSPGFIGKYRVVLFAIPLTVVIYCLLRKYFRLAVLGFLLFSLFISFRVNPLYRGLSVIEDNPLDTAIQQISKESPNARWVSTGTTIEDSILLDENLALLNGAPSLSGVYYYPQPSIWKSIGPGNQSFIYNRYAHISFQLLGSGDPNFTQLQLLGSDHYSVNTNVCSDFLQKNHVVYILTTQVLLSPCTTLVRQVVLPVQSFSIYKDDY